jgi:hypothetical protein
MNPPGGQVPLFKVSYAQAARDQLIVLWARATTQELKDAVFVRLENH